MIEPVSDNILNLVNELYNNLDAKDKIINEQALEIARLKEVNEGLTRATNKNAIKIFKAKSYLETHEIVDGYELYKILEGDKETPKGFKSYEDYKKKEEAFIKHFCKGDKE